MGVAGLAQGVLPPSFGNLAILPARRVPFPSHRPAFSSLLDGLVPRLTQESAIPAGSATIAQSATLIRRVMFAGVKVVSFLLKAPCTGPYLLVRNWRVCELTPLSEALAGLLLAWAARLLSPCQRLL